MNDHDCTAHEPEHVHGPDCGHPRIRHEDHYDFVVDGHLHHLTGKRCVHHGRLPADADPR